VPEPGLDPEPTRPPAGTAFVDYVMTDSVIVALVVTTGRTTIVPLTVRAQVVADHVRALHQALDVRVGSALDVLRARFPLDVAHKLYTGLVAPVEAYFAGASRVVFIPDGYLALVPFDALVTEQSGGAGMADEADASFLLDRYVVASAATLSVHPSAMQVPGGPIVVVAPSNIPGAEGELAAIAGSVPRSRFVSSSGVNATRASTLARVHDAGILHFAAHAEANGADPGESWIGLEPDEADDGALPASEIATLRLRGSLVVLSACETARGRALDGEGVLSISRSFLRAGARATVATLWPVGPSAAEFAAAFYPELMRSGDAALAMRHAKRSLRTAGVPAFAWAPYQLVAGPGSPGPRVGAVGSTGR